MLPNPTQQETAPEPETSGKFSKLRTALLIGGSALFGGLAVVLWNRKTLAKLRQPVEVPEPPSTDADASDT